ncbi:AraC family transcriptional regulator [Caldifermentibacillus hisashii]|uniref:AraC family transcriptional regulator n=1 Tax=Caldifermentibacillus hisashii TaxID=996558 RepID=UPI002E096545|nr:helix-turn-helix domain-containing protein [Caldifermentibacillus hisashii]MEC5273650.1 helix-turn-helix domain-containing protein [Caldifermentibacillus hisashii]
MNKKVIERLKTYTIQEKTQLMENRFVDNILDKDKKMENNSFKILNSLFYNNKDIYISKHNRFSDYPLHSHQFIEINYVISGTCTEIVEDEIVTLRAGDLIFLDIGCKHSIKALSENDIMVNIIFSDKSINIQWLSEMKKSNNIIFEFLVNVLSGIDNLQKYIIYRNKKPSEVSLVLEKIIEEYYLQKPFADIIISSLLTIFFTELVRNYNIKAEERITPHQSLVISILKDIEENYKNINLGNLANKYGYNKNYLSNLIKKETNHTFSELVIRQKLIKAHALITSTSMPIDDIILTVGFSNKHFFYEKYKLHYKTLPNEMRKKYRK